MKNIYLKITILLVSILFTTACSEDDLTGASTQQAANPSLTVALDFANSQSLIETEATYNFTVTLSEPQIVDTRVYLKQTGGDATNGDDFSIPSSVTIPKGATSVSDVITIHEDDLIEDTETATILIGTGFESNVSTTNSQTVSFTIMNLTEADLAVGMSWNTSETITDNYGHEIDAYDAGDLRLLLTDVPYTTIFDGSDGGSAETYVLDGAAPDREYYIVADFYAATEIPVDFDITLTFDQVGVINGQTHVFKNALSNSSICPENYVVLAKVTKTGSSYSFEEIGAPNFVTNTWSGVDTYDFYAPDGWDSKIVSKVDCDGTFFLGLNAEWMLEVWGEVIQEEGNVYYTIDGSGVITIPSQYIFTTLYSGALYDYTVSGTGTYDDSGDKPVIHLEYVLDQDGFDVGAYWNSVGGMATTYFVADIVLD